MSALDSFRELGKTATATTNSSIIPWHNKELNKWAERRFQVAELKYDVRKTESLVSPFVGVITFTLTNTQTELFSERSAAQASIDLDSTVYTFEVELNYAYQDNQWRTTAGRYSMPEDPVPFNLTPANIRNNPDTTPNAALVFWLR